MPESKIPKAVVECFSLSKKCSYYLRSMLRGDRNFDEESESSLSFALTEMGISYEQYNVLNSLLKDKSKTLFTRILKSSYDKRLQHVKVYCVDADQVESVLYNKSDWPKSDEVIWR